MSSIFSVVVVVLAIFGASVLIERAFGRSRKEFHKLGWYIVFFCVFVPGIAVVYLSFSVDSPYIFAIYGLSGGISALIAQYFYGIKLQVPPEQK